MKSKLPIAVEYTSCNAAQEHAASRWRSPRWCCHRGDLAGVRARLAGGIEARHDVIEELLTRAKVVAETEALERRTVDENDLRLDVHLRLADIEAARVLLELGSALGTSVMLMLLVIVSAVTAPRCGHWRL